MHHQDGIFKELFPVFGVVTLILRRNCRAISSLKKEVFIFSCASGYTAFLCVLLVNMIFYVFLSKMADPTLDTYIPHVKISI